MITNNAQLCLNKKFLIIMIRCFVFQLLLGTVFSPIISVAQKPNNPCPDLPDVIENYDSLATNYHKYHAKDYEICDLKEFPKASRLMVFQILLDHSCFAAPDAPDEPIENCRPIELPKFGSIVQRINPTEFSVTNYTRSDHAFRDGKVMRQIIQVGSKILIRTTGVGININWKRKVLNANCFSVWYVWTDVNKEFKQMVQSKLKNLLVRKPLSYSLLYKDYYSMGKFNYSLLGKYTSGLPVFIADHPAGSSYNLITGTNRKPQFECDVNQASKVVTLLKSVPAGATTEDKEFESITGIFNAQGMQYKPVTIFDAGPATLKTMVEESGVLKKLVASGKTSQQDYDNMFKGFPNISMLDIPCMEAYIVRYYADFGWDKWIGAQVIVINGKVFPLSGRRAKEKLYFYRLGDEYYMRIGFLKGGSGQEQIWKLTTEGLVQVYVGIPAC